MTRGGGRWCFCSRITVVVCCVNLLAVLYVLRSLCASIYVFSSSSPASSGLISLSGAKFSDDHVAKIVEYIRLRRAAQPIKLINVVQRLNKELINKDRHLNLSEPVKQDLANELLERLKRLGSDANSTFQRDALERWRVDKLEYVKKMMENVTLNSSLTPAEVETLKNAFESDWLTLLENIGVWIPIEVVNKEINDKPENADDPEIIPGRPVPAECHAELHTDYDGFAVRWGLTHHKESAADCCQACFDQAKHAKPGEMKCNIWVYCSSESGCYSPDIYEHKHQECWLKQADKPRLNFKDEYSESYRSLHPSAPVVVPWMSGVIG
ncbi:dimethylallyl, adenosine tRNA methylthiotransferase [Wolffia australiana]